MSLVADPRVRVTPLTGHGATAPQTSFAITFSVSRYAPETTRLERYRNELAAGTLEELEDALIQADFGLETAMRISEVVGKGRYEKGISPDEVRAILAAEVEQALRGRAVSAGLDALEELQQRLGEREQGKSARAASGTSEVLDALVRGQVDTLLLDPAAAAETTLNPSDVPGLDLGAVTTLDALPADQVLVALGALTDADVRVGRRRTLDGQPVAAVLRWDNEAEPEAPSASR